MANPYSVSVATAPTLVYSPQTTTDHVYIANNGNTTLYLGQAGVSALTGLPLPPKQIVDLAIVQVPIYAASGGAGIGALSGTVITTALAKGATSITVTSGGGSWTQGMLLQFNDGSTSEVVTVGAGSTGGNIVIGATVFPHLVGATFTQLLGGGGGTLQVTAGAR